MEKTNKTHTSTDFFQFFKKLSFIISKQLQTVLEVQLVN